MKTKVIISKKLVLVNAFSGAIIVWIDNNNIIGYDLSGAGKFTICADGAEFGQG